MLVRRKNTEYFIWTHRSLHWHKLSTTIKVGNSKQSTIHNLICLFHAYKSIKFIFSARTHQNLMFKWKCHSIRWREADVIYFKISHKSLISPWMHSFALNDIRESLLNRHKVPRQQSTSNTLLELLMSSIALHCSQLFIPFAKSGGSSSDYDYDWMHSVSLFFSNIHRCCSIIWRWSSRSHNTLSCSRSHPSHSVC